jgi:hypothetical protein
MAQSPQLLCDNNEILRMKCKFYKDLDQHLKSEQPSQDEIEDEDVPAPKPKIIASHNFLNSPKKNKHKVLKTKNKIFVV